MRELPDDRRTPPIVASFPSASTQGPALGPRATAEGGSDVRSVPSAGCQAGNDRDGLVGDGVVKGQVFSKADLEVPAGAPFRILLDNQDQHTAHGVAIGVGDTPAAAREAE